MYNRRDSMTNDENKEVECGYCKRIVPKSKAMLGNLDDNKSENFWICDNHINDINVISHLTYNKYGSINHIYSATRNELRALINDSTVTDIVILKAQINQSALQEQERWKPKRKNKAYRYGKN